MRGSPRAKAGAPRITAQFRQRWYELTGAAYSTRLRLPPMLVSSVATMRGGPVVVKAPGPAPGQEVSLVLVVRERQGRGCSKVAEIGGFYAKEFPAAAPFILGPVLVKQILDAAATALCIATLNCPPDKCPCTYIPQPTLAKYSVGATFETGYLLQGRRVWNCVCQVDAVEG